MVVPAWAAKTRPVYRVSFLLGGLSMNGIIYLVGLVVVVLAVLSFVGLR